MQVDDAVSARIRDHLAEDFLFSDDGFQYRDDDSFLDLGIIDSFGVVELVSFVEQEFGVTVNDAEIVPDNFDSVDKLTAFIVRKQGGAA